MHQLTFSRFPVCTLVLVLALLPVCAHATLNAGIVDGVWFSSANPADGEEVRIYTAVQNQSNEIVSGTVAFLVDGKIVGSAPFTVQSNGVIRVSTPYTFTGGDFDVSAYITSSQGSVTYTTVSKTPISVAPAATSPAYTPLGNLAKADGVQDATQAAFATGKDITNNLVPKIESAAQHIEAFRDTLANTPQAATSSAITSVSATTEQSAAVSFSHAKESAHTFSNDAKRIAQIDGLALWKKATSIALSLLAFLVRIWYVLLLLLFFYIFWRLVRGARIR